MEINIYELLGLTMEKFSDFVSRYDFELNSFLSEFEDNTESLFIDYQKSYLKKMNQDIIEGINKLDSNDPQSEFVFNIYEKKLSTNRRILEFLDNRLSAPQKVILPELKENISTDLKIVTDKNEFPSDVFRDYNSFEKFKTYIHRRHIISFYKDFSYLKKRMEKENFIMRITDSKFASWLLGKNYISLNDYDIFLKKESKFESLDKARSEQRENNFNNIFFD